MGRVDKWKNISLPTHCMGHAIDLCWVPLLHVRRVTWDPPQLLHILGECRYREVLLLQYRLFHPEFWIHHHHCLQCHESQEPQPHLCLDGPAVELRRPGLAFLLQEPHEKLPQHDALVPDIQRLVRCYSLLDSWNVVEEVPNWSEQPGGGEEEDDAGEEGQAGREEQ